MQRQSRESHTMRQQIINEVKLLISTAWMFNAQENKMDLGQGDDIPQTGNLAVLPNRPIHIRHRVTLRYLAVTA